MRFETGTFSSSIELRMPSRSEHQPVIPLDVVLLAFHGDQLMKTGHPFICGFLLDK